MPKYKRLQRLLYHPCSYRQHLKTAHRALQRLFLRLYPLNRPRYQTDKSGYNTARVTLERITAPPAHTRYQRRAGRFAGQHSRPIIIMYIRGGGQRCAPCYGSMPDGAAYSRPCKPGGVSMFPTPGGLQSGTGSAWHTPPGGAVHQRGAAGGAEPLTATAVSLFGLSPDSQ